MGQTETEHGQLCGLDLAEVPRLLDPAYIHPKYHAKLLERDGLIFWEERQERWETTARGEKLVERIRSEHRITLRHDGGGPRWFLAGEPMHCGNTVLVLRPDATWLSTRFEVSWHKEGADAHRAGGRSPQLYIGGFPTLVATLSPGDLEFGIFRWPEKESS